jgi:putative transposase
MDSDEMKELMLYVIDLALDKYHFELINYTLMGNHFHFLIRTLNNGESISRIMQFIKSQFARRYNRMMNRTGPFWNERFSDTIIELTTDPVSTFFVVLLYIAYNPVKSKIVADPRDYPYGGIRCYLSEEYIPPVKITLHEYFLKLGTTFEERVRKFLEYEDRYRKRVFPESLFV